jgi:hypothetical protein
MNSAFIIKNKSQEHYLLEEYRAHIKKMKELKSNSTFLIKNNSYHTETSSQLHRTQSIPRRLISEPRGDD